MSITQITAAEGCLHWGHFKLRGAKYFGIGLMAAMVCATPRLAIAGSGTAPGQKEGAVAVAPVHEKAVSPGKMEAVGAAYWEMPLAFEVNEGQSDASVKFLCRGVGYGLYLTGSDTVLALKGVGQRKETVAGKGLKEGKGDGRDARGKVVSVAAGDVLRFKLLGAKAQTEVTGLEPLAGKSNYLIGNDPRQWHTNVAQYAKVKAGQVFDGIDLVYYGRQGQLEYDFQVGPGADPGAIRFAVEGARNVSLNARGELVLQTRGGDVIEHAPMIYQEVNGKRERIGGGYDVERVAEGGESAAVGFRVGAYDHARALVIDPVLAYSTYLGGRDSYDAGEGIAVDGSGNIYVTGATESTEFPTTAGAFQTTAAESGEIFVAKLNPNLSGTASLIYSTYVGGTGGSGFSSAAGIAVDGSGEAYITGQSSSSDYPVTASAYQAIPLGGGGWTTITKLNASGSNLVYSTFLTGTVAYGYGNGIAVDGSGNAYVTGQTWAEGFPVTAGAFQTSVADTAAGTYVAKLNPKLSGSASLVYCTFIDGSETRAVDEGNAIAVDGSGNVYITGKTASPDFPTTAGAFQTTLTGTNAANGNVIVAKLNPNVSGTAGLVYSTFLGGSTRYGNDIGSGIAVDGSGNIYITGRTGSADFPITAGAYQATFSGTFAYIDDEDVFVVKLNPNVSGNAGLLYSTYLGGGGTESGDSGLGIAVDGSGNAYVTGYTNSTKFPVTAGAIKTGLTKTFDNGAFVSEVNPNLSGSASLVYSTYLDGNAQNGGETGFGIAVDGSGGAYVTGQTGSGDFPTTTNAYQTGLPGTFDVFVTYLNLGSGSSAKTEIVTPSAGANGAIGPNTAQTVISGSSVTFTATPNTGYVVNQWLLNGVVVQAGGTTYTLNDVTANAGVEVTFEAAYTVTPSAGGNGAINPSTAQTVTIGGGVTFTATPNAGYAVNQWLLNAGAVQTGGTTYTLNDVTSNDSVEVTFEAGYTVTPSAGANGAINPSTAQTVSSGGSVTFTATPAAGYVVNQWLVSGTLAQISGTSYTLSDVTGTDTVNVSFTAAPYPGTYYGLFAGGTNSISVTVSAGKKTKGKFTGKMYYGGVSHTLKGQFDSEGAATAGSPVAVSMQLGGGQDGTPGSYVVTGTVAGGGSATAYHTAYAKGKVIAEAGKTTVQLAPATSGTAGTSGTTGTTIPQGPGKATLTVSKTGTAHFAGKLPDGKAFSASATIVGGPLGDQCLIYSRINYPHATPAGTRGLLSGAITFPSGVVTGPLLWVKPEQTKGAYLGAINTSVSISP